jgi:hypothetical protein
MIAKDLAPLSGINSFAIMRNLPMTPVSAIFKEPGGVGGKSRGA